MNKAPFLLLARCWFLGAVTAVSLLATAYAGTITGKVVAVVDGDTITVLTAEKSQIKIRLAGIDAPESGQEYGQKSKHALSALVAGKTVQVTDEGKDRYGRTIGWVKSGGADVNRQMVKSGWAWHFTQYNRDAGITTLQKEAEADHRGFWAAENPPMPPWEYRALKRRETAAAKRPTKNPVENTGNYWINSNFVRHNNTCRWFGKTKSGRSGTKSEGRACGECGG